jgi:hypothetical protein
LGGEALLGSRYCSLESPLMNERSGKVHNSIIARSESGGHFSL